LGWQKTSLTPFAEKVWPKLSAAENQDCPSLARIRILRGALAVGRVLESKACQLLEKQSVFQMLNYQFNLHARNTQT